MRIMSKMRAMIVPDAQLRFIEFFTANIRNRNTRRAHAQAVGEFLVWCEKRRVPSIIAVQPVRSAPIARGSAPRCSRRRGWMYLPAAQSRASTAPVTTGAASTVDRNSEGAHPSGDKAVIDTASARSYPDHAVINITKDQLIKFSR
jgi:hypothetical protein